MGKEEIWAVLCVYNFLKSRSKNAEAFLKEDEKVPFPVTDVKM